MCSHVLFCLLCLAWTPEKMLLLDPAKGASVKKQHSASKASASRKERETAVNEPSQPRRQKHSSAETVAGSIGIVLNLSTGTAVPVQTPQPKVKKQAGSKSKGSGGKRDGAHTKDTGLLSAPAAELKKTSSDEAGSVACGAKAQSNMKKRRHSKTEATSSKDGAATQLLAIDKLADLSMNQPSEHKNAPSDKGDSVGPIQKLQSGVKIQTTLKHGEHGAGDSSNAKMAATKKATSLTSSSLHEHKKLPGAGTGQVSKMKKHVNSDSKEHAGKSVTDVKVAAGADSQSSFPQRKKLSFDGDRTPGLSQQKSSQSKVKKPVCSSAEGRGAGDSANTALTENVSSDKSANFPSNKAAKWKNLSFDSEKNERTKFAGSKAESGIGGQGSNNANRVSSQLAGAGGQCQDQKQSQPTKHASTTSLVPQAEKTHRAKTTIHATSDDVRSRLKFHQRSLSDSHEAVHSQLKNSDVPVAAVADAVSRPKPLHRQRQSTDGCYPESHTGPAPVVSGDGLRHEKPGISATAEDILGHPSQHAKPLHWQRHSSSCLKSRSESAMAVVSGDGLQTEKPPQWKTLGAASHGSIEHLEAKHTQQHAVGESFQHEPEESFEKPKSKVVSLADYMKRKSDPSTGKPAAVTSSKSATNGSQADGHCMTSSLAEQLMMFYSSHTHSDRPAYECAPVVESLHSLEITHDDAATIGQEQGSFGDMSNFQRQGRGIWPPMQLQHQRESPMFGSVDGYGVSSASYGSCSDRVESAQVNAHVVSGDNKRQQDCDIVAKETRKEPVSSRSSLSLEAGFSWKTMELEDDFLEPTVSRSRTCSDSVKGEPQKMESDVSGKGASSFGPPAFISSHELTTGPCVTNSDAAAAGLTNVLEEFIASAKQVELALASDNNENSSKVKQSVGDRDIGLNGIESELSQVVDSVMDVQGSSLAQAHGDIGQKAIESELSQVVDSVMDVQGCSLAQADGDIGQKGTESQFAESGMNVQDNPPSSAVADEGTPAAESELEAKSYVGVVFSSSAAALTDVEGQSESTMEEHMEERLTPSTDVAAAADTPLAADSPPPSNYHSNFLMMTASYLNICYF